MRAFALGLLIAAVYGMWRRQLAFERELVAQVVRAFEDRTREDERFVRQVNKVIRDGFRQVAR